MPVAGSATAVVAAGIAVATVGLIETEGAAGVVGSGLAVVEIEVLTAGAAETTPIEESAAGVAAKA